MRFLICLFVLLPLQLNAGETISAETMSTLTKLDGSVFPIESPRAFVYFWATWCPDCKEKLHKEFPTMQLPSDVTLVTINTDKDLGRAKNYVEKENLKLPVVRDNNKELAKRLKVFSVPFWAILEKAGAGWQVVDAEAGGNFDKAKAALKVVK